MKRIDVRQMAAGAVAANPTRAAMTIVHDSPDARIVVFRIAPGQAVPPHRNTSTVTLTVISGQGLISGGDTERIAVAGDTIVFEPNELHGMRSETEEVVLLATITPRPSSRRAEASETVGVARAVAAVAVAGTGGAR